MVEPKEGDVLIIGHGEKASRHTLGYDKWNEGCFEIAPSFAGFDVIAMEMVKGLVQTNAAHVEVSR